MDEEIFNTLQHAIQEAQTRLDVHLEEQKSDVYAMLGARYYDIVTNLHLRASHKKELLGDLQEDARIFQRNLEYGDPVVHQEQNVIRILSELQPLVDRVGEGDDPVDAGFSLSYQRTETMDERNVPREANPVPPKWRSFKNNQ